MRRVILGLLMLPMMAPGQTLEECQQAAERNYPLIRQYGLIERTTELTVANIRKGWLPQVTASAQATYQSDVTAFP
ncbi:MAG: transporter, partial [Prevotella sp.]|nr:transporter [Prevotella sp.]